MPKILHHLTCSIVVAAAVGAGAAFADPGTAPAAAPSMSEEMLRVWQMRDVIDAAPLSVHQFDDSGAPDAGDGEASPSHVWQLEPQRGETPVSSPGISTSTGGSLTPNLDRLMQRTYQPLVPSDAPGVTSTATPAPWGERSFSKSGSNSLDGKKKNKRSGGNHGGGNHYGGNRYNGGYNCSHSHHGGCGGQCGHPHCHNPGKNDNHGGHGGGGGGGGDDCDPPTPTPEPATLLLFGAAAAAAGVRKRRQRN